MGLYDRDYVRDEPRGLVLSGQRSVVANLIIANVAVFLLDLLLSGEGAGNRHRLNEFLVLHTDVWQTWRLWEFVTYAFAHHDVLHLLFNMLMLWIFGRDVEIIYGRKLFLSFYLSSAVLAGGIWLAVELATPLKPAAGLLGASGAVAAVFVTYVCRYPRRTLLLWGLIPMPAWVLGVVLLGLEVLGIQKRDGNIAHSAHLAGALFGYVFYRWHWTLWTWLPGKNLLAKAVRWRRGQRLRVHREPDDTNDWADDDLEQEVDRILAKISQHGTDSLTPQERKLLQRASLAAKRKMRS
jgi:membrane associated rhomboid family serine protease